MASNKKNKAPIFPTESTSFFEIQILNLNTKLAKLLTLHQEVEKQKEEAENKYKVLTEDRADVVSYLQIVLNQKIIENKVLNNKVCELEENHEKEAKTHNAVIKKMKEEHKLLNDTLHADIQMLNGRLCVLEEFRQNKEELMKKFTTLQDLEVQQESRHKHELYEVEKGFAMEKDHLKKSMQARLVQLSTDFQNVTEVRIAATTQREITKNISCNNELNISINTHRKLYNENTRLKERDTLLKCEAELEAEEMQQAVLKSVFQLRHISKLTTEIHDMQQKLEEFKQAKTESENLKTELNSLTTENCNLQFRIRLLEQNLHDDLYKRGCLKTELDFYKSRLNCLLYIANKSFTSIKIALKTQSKHKKKHNKKTLNHENLVQNLLIQISKAREEKTEYPLLDSIDSISALYSQGSLGLVPKPVVLLHNITLKDKETIMGSSFEELLDNSVPVGVVDIKDNEKDPDQPLQ